MAEPVELNSFSNSWVSRIVRSVKKSEGNLDATRDRKRRTPIGGGENRNQSSGGSGGTGGGGCCCEEQACLPKVKGAVNAYWPRSYHFYTNNLICKCTAPQGLVTLLPTNDTKMIWESDSALNSCQGGTQQQVGCTNTATWTWAPTSWTLSSVSDSACSCTPTAPADAPIWDGTGSNPTATTTCTGHKNVDGSSAYFPAFWRLTIAARDSSGCDSATKLEFVVGSVAVLTYYLDRPCPPARGFCPPCTNTFRAANCHGECQLAPTIICLEPLIPEPPELSCPEQNWSITLPAVLLCDVTTVSCACFNADLGTLAMGVDTLFGGEYAAWTTAPFIWGKNPGCKATTGGTGYEAGSDLTVSLKVRIRIAIKGGSCGACGYGWYVGMYIQDKEYCSSSNESGTMNFAACINSLADLQPIAFALAAAFGYSQICSGSSLTHFALCGWNTLNPPSPLNVGHYAGVTISEPLP